MFSFLFIILIWKSLKRNYVYYIDCFSILKDFVVTSHHRVTPLVKQEIWNKTCCRWIKENIDGAIWVSLVLSMLVAFFRTIMRQLWVSFLLSWVTLLLITPISQRLCYLLRYIIKRVGRIFG